MKQRLDQLLVSRGLSPDLQTARGYILAGKVLVEDVVRDKPGSTFSPQVILRLKGECSYVSRGGHKLAKALDHFDLDPRGLICVDIGASTGGFTDCLLQRGAKQVYAVDVAYGQLAWSLRQDPRVVVIERFNARYITPATIDSAEVDLAVIDASFISLEKLLAPVISLFPRRAQIVALVKPQFELARQDIGDKGVVKDGHLHDKAVASIKACGIELGLQFRGVVESPITGPKGNKEFLVYITSE